MRKKLDRSQTVLQFIEKYMTENGYSPSVREICDGCKIPSTATCFNIMNELAEKGLIVKSKVGANKRRSVSIKQNAVKVPLIGTVAAGEPIFAQENYEDYFSVPSNLFGTEDLFMLTVQGNSMIKIGMLNGDKVIVRKQETAENGEIVVALVDDSATVKRFYKRDGKFILHPENDDMEDFVFDNVSILGKVVGLLRNI
ncbi:MAG: transcriptional repressor LexA [Candidatus Coproplasma sp.]